MSNWCLQNTSQQLAKHIIVKTNTADCESLEKLLILDMYCKTSSYQRSTIPFKEEVKIENSHQNSRSKEKD